MIRNELLSRVQDADIGYIYDQRENSRWGMLRGLPAISYLGAQDFTYPTSWCQFDRGTRVLEFDYDYHVVSNALDIPDSNPEFGVVTNTHYEQETQYTIRYLIKRYTAADAVLWVVTDNREFEPQGAKRPLYQEPFVDVVGSYSDVYEVFEAAYADAGWELPLSDTKNLFVQDNALLYEFVTGDDISSTVDLFEKLPNEPYLPLFDAISAIFSRKNKPGTVPLDGESGLPQLVRWLRRRIEWDRETARTVAGELNERVVDSGRTFDHAAARRAPVVKTARARADELDVDASPIEQRYVTWLRRYKL
ncbi:hypothetical protein [Haloarchaeobius litoreus]|uniref:Uncharacterized protein n=1 Tax=Haloarchaeobius litoreus TaxID=755306 RepID=A0ABD6DLE5_9EURY|nr:hypothetical protein [Haloarchaeobius litoreus]